MSKDKMNGWQPKWLTINTPIPIELVERAANCSLLDCRCGGEAQILYICVTRAWAEIKCTRCQIRTEMQESPEEATEKWNMVMK